MRILHVINLGTTGGGAERLVAAVAAAQRRDGHQVLVLSSDQPGSGHSYSDVTWHEPDPPTRLLARLVRQLHNPPAGAALHDLVQRWQPEVVHLHTILLISPRSLRSLAGTPTVLTLHGPELYLGPTARWCLQPRYFRVRPDGERLTWPGRLALLAAQAVYGPLWRHALRVVDVRIAPSGYQAALAVPALGPTRVVPNALIDAGPPGPPAAASPAVGTPPTLLFAGRLECSKGVHVLLDAMPAVLSAHPDARLVLCGAGPQAAAVAGRVAATGLAGAVELAGWQDPAELSARLAAADVVVVPSLRPESFGLACAEALAAGVPVVASALGALPDLVRHEQTGLLVAPGDAAGLAAAVNRLLADRPLRARLGAAGRDLVSRYTLGAHLEQLQGAYRDARIRSRQRGDHPRTRPARQPAGVRPAAVRRDAPQPAAVRRDAPQRAAAGDPGPAARWAGQPAPVPHRSGTPAPDPPPSVTVVVPTHNGAAHIVGCVRSVLAQPYPRLEVIVADDKSTDGTVALLREQVPDDRLRILETDANGGPAAARNRAVLAARGELLFFTDDDVTVAADWVSAGARYFADPQVQGIEGKLFYVEEGYQPQYSDRIVQNLTGRQYMTANAAYRRDAVLRVGLFDPRLRSFEDRDLALKVRALGPVLFAPDVVARHRREVYTVRSFMSEAAKTRYWLALQEVHRERQGWLGPCYQPARLLAALVPPLVLPRLLTGRFASRRDFGLFLLIWPRLAYERLLIWSWAVRRRRLVL